MKLHIQSTIFGQLVRYVTANKVFQYPDEINPLLWKAATHESCSQHARQFSQDHANGADNEPKNNGDDAGTRGQQIDSGEDGPDTLVVCWYGPDDEEVRIHPFNVFDTIPTDPTFHA